MNTDRDLVERYFDAMRRGPDGVDTLLELFGEQAVYIEPFSGSTRTHRGKPAIAAVLRQSQATAPPEMTLTVDRIEVDAHGLFSEWTCSSPAFPAPMRGIDRYRIEDGAIARLEVQFQEAR